FVIELATLEWTYNEVFDGPGVEGRRLLRPEHLRAIPAERWPNARLVAVPCLRLLELRFPVHRYYSAVRREEGAEFPEPEETVIAGPRRRYVVRRYELSRPQFVLLAALLHGQSVGEGIDVAAKAVDSDVDRFAGDLQAWFRNWTAE